MNQKPLWLSWLYMFILCAVLGFIPEPTGLVKALLVLVSVGAFVPGFILLVKADHRDQVRTIRLVRNLSLISLGVTLVLIILNFMSVTMSEIWGTVFYFLLVIFSSPMVCGQYWVISLFGWACLMVTAVTMLKKRK